jgi:hypothetical protein
MGCYRDVWRDHRAFFGDVYERSMGAEESRGEDRFI